MTPFNVEYSINEEKGRIVVNFDEVSNVQLILDKKYLFFKDHYGENPDETDVVSYSRIGPRGDVYVNILCYERTINAWSENKASLRNLLVEELGLPNPFSNN